MRSNAWYGRERACQIRRRRRNTDPVVEPRLYRVAIGRGDVDRACSKQAAVVGACHEIAGGFA
ncbi:hypothetical protein, partial [Ensifer sp. 2YAB10]|uniref:hypothetical protein n=1 Tax=Ensifer sp. 2YAB10 TaxID=3233021 RepID=UPI003F901E77